MYTNVASRPGAVFHFPPGRLACLFVGYPVDQFDCLSAEATESFAGVGDPFAADVISQGDTVLDSGAPSKLTPGPPRRTLPSHEDFRYSMMAARSSAENAGPMTPLPRCVLEPVARVAVARLRGVEQSRPCQFVANARVPGGRGRRTMSRDLPARCSADGRSDPRCRQAPTRRLCPGHPCSRCGA